MPRILTVTPKPDEQPADFAKRVAGQVDQFFTEEVAPVEPPLPPDAEDQTVDSLDPDQPVTDLDTGDTEPSAPLDQGQTDTEAQSPSEAQAAMLPALEELFARGPGWITNPEGTRRLHAYWIHGEGGAKIRWGTDGDFDRCRRLVGKEIGKNSPEDLKFINQICSRWHHDATGAWPGHAPGESPPRRGH